MTNHEMALLAALKDMVARWEPDTSGQDRVMWENACAAIEAAQVRPSTDSTYCTDGNACPLPNTQCQWPECRAPESGLGLLGRLGMDAAKWCAEMAARGVVQADPSPGETFHVWMCNAIMTAHDIGFAAGERRTETERMLPLLKQSLQLARPWMRATAGQQPPIEWEKWAEAVDSICGMIDQLSPKSEAKP